MTSCCSGLAPPRKIVLTGGPGAGKTAVLELVRRSMCQQIRILPEAASVVFGGGFPRRTVLAHRRAAQRAIFYVQRELEATVDGDVLSLVLCDRGTPDGAAYWPGPDDMFASLGTSLAEQLARYDAVIHLRTPSAGHYNHDNPLRIETEAEAAAIDERIAAVWAEHPRRFEVPATPDFLSKALAAIAIVRGEVPAACLAQVPLTARPPRHAAAVADLPRLRDPADHT